ncbi:MAG: hypothetical protein ABI210_14120 [Abditibacteriaceae bacterium]
MINDKVFGTCFAAVQNVRLSEAEALSKVLFSNDSIGHTSFSPRVGSISVTNARIRHLHKLWT